MQNQFGVRSQKDFKKCKLNFIKLENQKYTSCRPKNGKFISAINIRRKLKRKHKRFGKRIIETRNR